MRKFLLTAAISGLLLGPLSGSAIADHSNDPGPLTGGAEGCTANSQNLEPGAPGIRKGHCNYNPTRPGIYQAQGENWTITLKRPYTPSLAAQTGKIAHIDTDGLSGPDQTLITFTAANALDSCSSAIVPADIRVTAEVGADSFVFIGNPLPSGNDQLTSPEDVMACFE